jgi:hypothetical protein
MRLARVALVLVAALLVGGGYAVSQAAFFGQTTEQYIRALDQSPVPILALLILAAAVVLAFLPSNEEDAL